MSIQAAEHRRGVFGPQLMCDVCQQPIKNYALAMGSYADDGKVVKFSTIHKGACARVSDTSCWTELREVLVQLLYNSGMDKRDYRAAHKRLTDSPI